MKKITISPITLIGIILIMVALIIGGISYYNYNNRECLRDPLTYANEHSDSYWWDSVQAIKYDMYDQFEGDFFIIEEDD